MIAPLINLNIGKWKEGEEEEGGVTASFKYAFSL